MSLRHRRKQRVARWSTRRKLRFKSKLRLRLRLRLRRTAKPLIRVRRKRRRMIGPRLTKSTKTIGRNCIKFSIPSSNSLPTISSIRRYLRL